MAADTIQCRILAMTQDFTNYAAMTLDAVVPQNHAVASTDANGFVEVLKREALGMPKPIFRFGQVFADEVMRRVTVIARRHGVMAGFLPTVVFIAHDMAIDAGFRVIAKIRAAFRVIKRIPAHAEYNAQKN
jgi:hypothetical protein